MSHTAQVLVQLLEMVPDTDQLQRLLEMDNLTYLWRRYGHSQQDMQQRLANGTLPGEFLLELLAQEPNASQLLAQLHNDMETRREPRVVLDQIISEVKKKAEAEAAALSTSLEDSDTKTGLQKVEVGAPISDDVSTLSNSPYRMIVLGLIALAGVLGAALLYTQMRPAFAPIEIVIPLVVGVLPALALSFVLLRKS